jgi:hypothetical protein
MTTPTTEKKPVTTANPDNGILSPPSGTSKSTPMARASAAARVVATVAASVAMKSHGRALESSQRGRLGCGVLAAQREPEQQRTQQHVGAAVQVCPALRKVVVRIAPSQRFDHETGDPLR